MEFKLINTSCSFIVIYDTINYMWITEKFNKKAKLNNTGTINLDFSFRENNIVYINFL